MLDKHSQQHPFSTDVLEFKNILNYLYQDLAGGNSVATTWKV